METTTVGLLELHVRNRNLQLTSDTYGQSGAFGRHDTVPGPDADPKPCRNHVESFSQETVHTMTKLRLSAGPSAAVPHSHRRVSGVRRCVRYELLQLLLCLEIILRPSGLGLIGLLTRLALIPVDTAARQLDQALDAAAGGGASVSAPGEEERGRGGGSWRLRWQWVVRRISAIAGIRQDAETPVDGVGSRLEVEAGAGGSGSATGRHLGKGVHGRCRLAGRRCQWRNLATKRYKPSTALRTGVCEINGAILAIGHDGRRRRRTAFFSVSPFSHRIRPISARGYLPRISLVPSSRELFGSVWL